MASLNPNLTDFWFNGEPSDATFRKTRHRVLYGGRASSKSWEFAGMVASIASQYKTRVLCVRRFQNKIKESVHTLIAAQIDNFNMGGFDVRATDIQHENGSEFVFYGIERNTDEIKSFEGADILWIEEAHNLTKDQWDTLEPTIRKSGSEVWISFNPDLITDFVYQRFVVNPPKNSIIRKVNYPENPFLSDTMRSVINEKKLEDFEDYEHIYLGVPRSTDARAVIKRSWVEAAIDAHNKITPINSTWQGAYVAGYDVADDGDDKNAVAIIGGSVIAYIKEWKGNTDELTESALKARDIAKQFNAKEIGYDSIGVGASAGSILNDHGWKDHYKFNAGSSVHKPDDEYEKNVTNKELFANLKAQAWWLLADRFRNTYNAIMKGAEYSADQMISISSDIDKKHLDQLVIELSTPLRVKNSQGKVQVESKADLDKRKIASPNIADAVIIAASHHIVDRGSGYNWDAFA